MRVGEAGKGKALMPKVTFPVPHSGPAPMPDWPVQSATGPAAGPSESLSLCEWGDPESRGKWWMGPGKRLPAKHLPHVFMGYRLF